MKYFSVSAGQVGEDYTQKNFPKFFEENVFFFSKNTQRKGSYDKIQEGDILILKTPDLFVAYGKVSRINIDEETFWGYRFYVDSWISHNSEIKEAGVSFTDISKYTEDFQYSTVKELGENFAYQKLKEINSDNLLFFKVTEKKFEKELEEINANIKLNEVEKNNLKSLWDAYFKSKESDLEEIGTEAKKQIDDFESHYIDKIKDGSFKLDDYTSRLGKKSELSGGYLCNFLERETSKLFGSSKPAGSALSFGIKADERENSFTIGGKDHENHNKNNRHEAVEEFKKFKKFFEEVVSAKQVSKQIFLIENCKFIGAKQILRKFLYLLRPNEFVMIYNEVIDELYRYFFEDESEGLTSAEKSYQIHKAVTGIMELTPLTVAENILLSRFLWQLGNGHSYVNPNNPNVILYGPPGTGKSFNVLNAVNFYAHGDSSRIENVQFHPSFGYEDFIEGIKPVGITANGSIKFQVLNGVFKAFCIKAKSDPENDYFFVADEINRADLSALFGEALFLLEKDYRRKVRFDNRKEKINEEEYKKATHGLIKTQYSNLIKSLDDETKKELSFDRVNSEEYFGIPENLYFIGMMNDVDKNIDTFDLALRRRFKWIRMDCDYNVLESEISHKGKEYKNLQEYREGCEAFNKYISEELNMGKSYEFGHSFFMKIQDYTKSTKITEDSVKKLFDFYLKPTLEEYLRAFFDESEIEKKTKEAYSKLVSKLG